MTDENTHLDELHRKFKEAIKTHDDGISDETKQLAFDLMKKHGAQIYEELEARRQQQKKEEEDELKRRRAVNHLFSDEELAKWRK